MSTISLDDPRALEQLRALFGTGEEILVTDGNTVAKLEKVVDRPAQAKLPPRVPGRWAHLNIEVAPDFDDELPDSFWFGEDK